MKIRVFLKNGNDIGILVTKLVTKNGIYENSKFLFTEAGRIDKRLIQEWQIVDDTEANGANQNLPPLW